MAQEAGSEPLDNPNSEFTLDKWKCFGCTVSRYARHVPHGCGKYFVQCDRSYYTAVHGDHIANRNCPCGEQLSDRTAAGQPHEAEELDKLRIGLPPLSRSRLR